MAQTYFLSSSASDLSVPGDDFDNQMANAVGSDTLSQTTAKTATETSYGFTSANEPSDNGGTGAQSYTVTIEINTGNADVELAINLHRINSTGTVQASAGISAEQTATTGPLTYTFASLDLGTFASGDRVRIDFQTRATSLHNAEQLIYDLGSGTSGTRLLAPWTAVVSSTKVMIIS